MLVLFAPIVRFLVSGASSLEVPFIVLLLPGRWRFIVIRWLPGRSSATS